MALSINKSAIKQVRDELSLDFAANEYLDTISQNLGLHKHLFTFDDAIWRALIKTLAIEYKQVASKYEDVLEILFGPKVTQVGTLSQSVEVGDTCCYMNDTSNFPQVGTLIFDEGLAEEETLEYILIDRTNNEVALRTEFAFAHPARIQDAESPFLAIGTAGDVVCARTDTFPNTDYPYPVVVDRGQPTETVYSVTANNRDISTLTLSPSPSGLRHHSYVSDITDTVAVTHFPGSTYIILNDSTKFPDSGTIKVTSSFNVVVSANSSGLSDDTVTFPASTFDANTLAGYECVFIGGGLTGIHRRVVSNTASVLTLDRDFTGEGAFPTIGVVVLFYAIVPYTSNDYSQNTLTLQRSFALKTLVPDTSAVELLEDKNTVALSPVKYGGAGWDVIQSTPKLVEVYIPEEIRDINDIRSASYLHDDELPVIAAVQTLLLEAPAGTSVLRFAGAGVDFPDSGVLLIDEGNPGEEIISYSRASSASETDIIEGAPTITLENSNPFPNNGVIVLDQGSNEEETLSYSANDTGTGILTLAGLTQFEHKAGTVITHASYLKTQTPLVNTHAVGVIVQLYDPQHSGTSTPLGDFNQDPNTYPGPYIYSLYDPAPTPTTTSAALVDLGRRTYDSSTVGAPLSTQLRANFVNPTLITQIRIGDQAIGGADMSAFISAIVPGDIIRIEWDTDPSMWGLYTFSAVPGAPVDNGTWYRLDVTFDSMSPGFNLSSPPDFDDGSVVHVYVGGAMDISPTDMIPGPTYLAIDQYKGRSALEVETALAMYQNLAIPFKVNLGREIRDVAHIAIKARSVTTLSAPVSIGSNLLPLASLVNMPTVGIGYRLVIDEGGANQEVVYATGFIGPSVLIETPTVVDHLINETVRLMSDVLSLDLNLNLDHTGLVSGAERSTALAVGPAQDAYFSRARYLRHTRLVRPLVDCFTVDNVAGLDTSGGRVLLNFGGELLPAKTTITNNPSANNTVLSLADATGFPATFPYIVVVAPGTVKQDYVLVLGKSVNNLTLAGGVQGLAGLAYGHSAGTDVSFLPGQYEALKYTSVETDDLCFEPAVMLEYTHYPAETILKSSADSYPSDDGYDFPLRVSVDLAAGLSYLLGLVRAAGVEVEIISER